MMEISSQFSATKIRSVKMILTDASTVLTFSLTFFVNTALKNTMKYKAEKE